MQQLDGFLVVLLKHDIKFLLFPLDPEQLAKFRIQGDLAHVIENNIRPRIRERNSLGSSSTTPFSGDCVDPEIIKERLEQALRFPPLRPLPLDADARSHPYVRDGQHLSLLDECNIPKMTSVSVSGKRTD